MAYAEQLVTTKLEKHTKMRLCRHLSSVCSLITCKIILTKLVGNTKLERLASTLREKFIVQNYETDEINRIRNQHI